MRSNFAQPQLKLLKVIKNLELYKAHYKALALGQNRTLIYYIEGKIFGRHLDNHDTRCLAFSLLFYSVRQFCYPAFHPSSLLRIFTTFKIL